MPYEEGIKEYQLEPAHPIHQSTLEYKGYVQHEIPKDVVVFYPFFDYLYEIWGMENIRLREQDTSIIFLVRAGEKPFTIKSFSNADFFPFVVNGEIFEEDGNLILRSAYRKTSIELPIDLLDQMAQVPTVKGKTFKETAVQWNIGEHHHSSI